MGNNNNYGLNAHCLHYQEGICASNHVNSCLQLTTVDYALITSSGCTKTVIRKSYSTTVVVLCCSESNSSAFSTQIMSLHIILLLVGC